MPTSTCSIATDFEGGNGARIRSPGLGSLRVDPGARAGGASIQRHVVLFLLWDPQSEARAAVQCRIQRRGPLAGNRVLWQWDRGTRWSVEVNVGTQLDPEAVHPVPDSDAVGDSTSLPPRRGRAR